MNQFTSNRSKGNLIEVRGLTKYFPSHSGILGRASSWAKAVDNVSFTIREGETLGLVGESGCGKTTLGLTILYLLVPTSGNVFFEGTNISFIRKDAQKLLRRHMQIIFQDPYSSLDPRIKIGKSIAEGLSIHHIGTPRERKDMVIDIMRKVGLEDHQFNRYPHEFSGGQRQRIGIARALALRPKFIVADEPVSALDVSIQADILNLLKDLQDKYDLTYLFIAHNISVVKHISDRVAIMYLGKIVEIASTPELFDKPQHPYTQALLSAVPVPDPLSKKERIILSGDVPSPINPPSGCHFHPRCQYVLDNLCSLYEPALINTGYNHQTACWLYGKK